VPTGCAAYTGAGNMKKIKYVIHAVGPIYKQANRETSEIELVSTLWSSLKLGAFLDCKSISIPAISSGIFGFPKPRCAELMIIGTYYYFKYINPSEQKQYKAINFTNYDKETVSIFHNAHQYITKKLDNPTDEINISFYENAKERFKTYSDAFITESLSNMNDVFQVFYEQNKYFKLNQSKSSKRVKLVNEVKQSCEIKKKEESHKKEESLQKLPTNATLIPNLNKSISFPITQGDVHSSSKQTNDKKDTESNNKNKLISDVISTAINAVECSIEEECNINADDDSHNSIKDNSN
jgi:Macro domain